MHASKVRQAHRLIVDLNPTAWSYSGRDRYAVFVLEEPAEGQQRRCMLDVFPDPYAAQRAFRSVVFVCDLEAYEREREERPWWGRPRTAKMGSRCRGRGR